MYFQPHPVVKILVGLFVAFPAYCSADTYYDAAYTVNGTTKSLSGQTFIATSDDESAILVTEGGQLTLTHCSIVKRGDSSDQSDSSFTDLNAAIGIEADGSITMYDSFIATDGYAANALHTYADGSSAYLYNVVVTTFNDSAHGVYVAGGYLYAENLTVTTNGMYCGCISTDTGGGTMVIENADVHSTGEKAALVYSTGNITAANLSGSTVRAFAGVIDGDNTITLTNPAISAAPDEYAVFRVFSSGASGSGDTGKIWITDGSIAETRGLCALLSTANIASELYLTNVNLTLASGLLVNSSADSSVGTSGQNGGQALISATSQRLVGDALVDSLSTVTIELSDSSYSGTINTANTGGVTTLSLDEQSSWNVTGTSYLSVLIDNHTDVSNIYSDGYIVYYNSSLNAWLEGENVTLSGGGSLIPM